MIDVSEKNTELGSAGAMFGIYEKMFTTFFLSSVLVCSGNHNKIAK